MPEREKVINDLQDAVNDDWMWQHADYYAKAMENAIALLKEHEVVRCKDCENWLCVKTPKNHGLTKCFLHEQFEPNGEWFCADGKRKVQLLEYADQDTAYYANQEVLRPLT